MAATPKYKTKLRLTNPWTQNFVAGVVLFLAIGFYLAILGLGAGGGRPSSASVTTTAYAVLYAVFTVSGFFGGSIMNTLGPRLTMAFGSGGAGIFVGGLWYFQDSGHSWFAIGGGAFVGVTAGCLWTTVGYIQSAYPVESQKGTYIAWQSFLLSSGCAVASLIVFFITKDITTLTGVPTSVYIVFICVMTSALVVSIVCIRPSDQIIREDGTHLAHFAATDFRTEFMGCLELLKDYRILLLILPMLGTEMSSALIPSITAQAFDLRTRSLSSLVNYVVQIPAVWIFGYVLDNKRYRRRIRGLMALGLCFTMVSIGWVLALEFQIRHGITRSSKSPGWDWTSPAYIEYFFVILFTGFAYTMLTMMVLWTLSALSNDPRLLARYSGLFKGMLSAGLAIAFGQEAGGVTFLGQTITQTTIQLISFPIMFGIILKCITDTNYFAEENVIPPQAVQDSAAAMHHGETFERSWDEKDFGAATLQMETAASK